MRTAFHVNIFLIMTALGSISPLMQAQAQEEAPPAPIFKVDYICERGVELQAVYINDPDSKESRAVIYTEGKLVPMNIWMSASGARYLAIDEQDSYRWHTKGDKGVLSFLEADDSATEQILLKDCAAIEPEL